MTRKLAKQLAKLKQNYERYLEAKAQLNNARLECNIRYDIYTEAASKVAEALRKENLTELVSEEGTFKLKREVQAKIIDRTAAEAYDQEYKLGLFVKSICGPRLKSWAREQLEKNLQIPPFVLVREIWTVGIEKN